MRLERSWTRWCCWRESTEGFFGGRGRDRGPGPRRRGSGRDALGGRDQVGGDREARLEVRGPGFFSFGGEREPVERHQAPIHGDVRSLLDFDQGVDSLDEVGDVEEIAAEGEVVGHDAEARRADGCAKRKQGGGGLGRGNRLRRRCGRGRGGRFAARRFFRAAAEFDAAELHMRAIRNLAHLDQQRGCFVIAGHGLAEHDELLVVDRELPARLDGFGGLASRFRQRGLQLRDFFAEFACLLARRAKDQYPERAAQHRHYQQRDDDASRGAHLSLLPKSWSRSLRTRPLRIRSRGFRASRRRGRRFFARRRRGNGGGIERHDDFEFGRGAACIRSCPPSPRSRWSRLRRRLRLSESSEDCTPTRVTPSMSLSEETKPATALCPVAQPTSSSAGPGTALRRLTLLPPSSVTSGLAVPVRLVSQTFPRGGSARVPASRVPSRSGCWRGW